MTQILNIVDENDNIIGTRSREDIHREGLFHREIHVYFITPNKEIIFQHRAPNKDMFPDLLDATVGGHVEIGDSYEESAVKELKEETGLDISSADLIFVNKIKKTNLDQATGKRNNVFNSRYVYIFRGDILDLKVEAGKATGFELWPLDRLLNINEADRTKFIPYILEFSSGELAEFINKLNF